MKVVNLFGGPSSGKSTAASGLHYMLKINGHRAEIVTEYAKELVYEDRVSFLLNRQELVFAEQHRRLHRLIDKIDYAVTDSPILLSCIYASDVLFGANHFRDFVKCVFLSYDNINVFLERPASFEKENRVHNKQESMMIDEQIKQLLTDLGLKYITIKSDRDIHLTLYNEVAFRDVKKIY